MPRHMGSGRSISKRTGLSRKRSACTDQRATRRSLRSTANRTHTTGSKSESRPDTRDLTGSRPEQGADVDGRNDEHGEGEAHVLGDLRRRWLEHESAEVPHEPAAEDPPTTLDESEHHDAQVQPTPPISHIC